MHKAFDLLNNKITFLVLDYNRPYNLYSCLTNIRAKTFVPHEIIALTNGGNIDYGYIALKNNLADKVLVSKNNEGSSLGAIRLVKNCTTKYFVFLQSDNLLNFNFDESILNKIELLLGSRSFGAIDLTGLVPTVTQFSERAFIMETDFYLQNNLHTGYGTGPFYNPQFKNSEQTTHEWILNNNLHVIGFQQNGVHVITESNKTPVIDSGMYGILQLPCGGVLRRRNDTHQVWVENLPKQKIDCYGLNDEEWDLILQNKWIGGTIPKNCEKNAFFFYNKNLDPIG